MENMKKIVLLLITLIGSVSCSGFLDEVDKDKMIPSKVEHFAAVILKSFNDNFPQYSYVEFLGDNITEYAPAENSTKVAAKPVFTWQIEIEIDENGRLLSGTNNAWEQNYKCIAAANYVIEMIDDAEGSQAERDYIKGEALFGRAWCFFNLQNLYGHLYNPQTAKTDLGIPLRIDNAIERFYDRASVRETWDQIERDLLQAKELIASSGVQKSKYHPSVEACNMLLARGYLFQQKWEEAIAYTSDVIANSELTTLNPKAPFITATSREVIYAAKRTKNTFSTSWRVNPDLIELFDQVNDNRFKAYFVRIDGMIGEVYNDNKVIGSYNTMDYSGVVIRVAEAYLMRAEAYAQRAEYSKARADITDLLRKRYSNLSAIPQPTDDQLLDFILRERRKELCFEEHHRWFDLRRVTNKKDIVHTITLNDESGMSVGTEKYVLLTNDPNYILPIPLRERENNTLIRNNERYDKIPVLE